MKASLRRGHRRRPGLRRRDRASAGARRRQGADRRPGGRDRGHPFDPRPDAPGRRAAGWLGAPRHAAGRRHAGVRQAQFQYGPDRVTVPVKSTRRRAGPDARRAAGCSTGRSWTPPPRPAPICRSGPPSRTCLADAAGRVVGVSVRRQDGTLFPVHADLVIGADGRTSRIAETVGAKLLSSSPHRAATVYGYFPGIPNEGYRWYFGDGVAAGAIPTNDGLHCVFAPAVPRTTRRVSRRIRTAAWRAIVGQFDPDLAERIRAAPAERLRRFPGAPGHIRARAGRRLGAGRRRRVLQGPGDRPRHHRRAPGRAPSVRLLGRDGGLERYRRERHAHGVGLFETTQKIASFDWDFEALKTLHATLNDCLKREQAALGTSASDGPAKRRRSMRPHGPPMSGGAPDPGTGDGAWRCVASLGRHRATGVCTPG